MSVSILDQKILWGRAAGRCAMPDCRKVVIQKTTENQYRTDIIFGENCHIVGEKADAARGESNMPTEDRNQYHNLILLCANHHTIIDKAPVDWPIERLHQIKTEHELWIESRLSETDLDPSTELYSQLVNTIADELQLHRWLNIGDCAIRGMLPVWFVEGSDAVKHKLFSVNWPGKIPSLERAIANLGERLSEMIDTFLSHAEPDEGHKIYREVKFYRKYWEKFMASQNHRDSEEHQRQLKNFDLYQRRTQVSLFNFVLALNEFAEEVRKSLNPKFFYFEGKFVVSDGLGVTNNGVPATYSPSKYEALPTHVP